MRGQRRLVVLWLSFAAMLAAGGCHRSAAAGGPRPSDGDEVRVGYGTQKRGDVTGAVASVTSTDFDRVHGDDMARALEGRVPGLLVVRRSGEVFLSIRGGGEPYVVIDGAPASARDLLALSPDMVARIDVRKDGGAAVYGFRGANGVLEVTTRRGRPPER